MTRKEDVIDNIRPGVLNKEQTKQLVENKIITNLDVGNIDSSSFDLHLSKLGWKMKGSIKPDRHTSCSKIIKDYKDTNLDLTNLTTLETGSTYIIQIKEDLNLPEGMRFFGRTTGKSSIGRLDVLTRLIVDKCHSYDTVDEEYSGSLYLEATPITFPINVKEGVALSQLRLFRGLPVWSEIKKEEIELFGKLILDKNFEPKKIQEVSELRVNLAPDPKTEHSAYCALKKNNNKELEIDLTKEKGSYYPEDFWEPIQCQNGELLEIKPEAFYILRSKERFRLPKDVAVYCQGISETLGELRIHYAGFVHPCFGFRREEGTPVIFEVRGHNVKTFLRDGETLANIIFYRMSQPADELTEESDYENQELALSKYFKEWGQKPK
jgi:dCTP deaminase